jgi:hypothetical protein
MNCWSVPIKITSENCFILVKIDTGLLPESDKDTETNLNFASLQTRLPVSNWEKSRRAGYDVHELSRRATYHFNEFEIFSGSRAKAKSSESKLIKLDVHLAKVLSAKQ